jgi:glycerol-3-phosphate dehydrogenase
VSVSRSEAIGRLGAESFDLLVIGGGITGAGIAQDAAQRGLRVALVEKGDFASGTTHASSELLHGGLRYLEQGQLRLMYEALHERNRLTRLAPGLAEWPPFLLPVYSRGWSVWRLRIGLWLYDLLAGFPRGHRHRWIGHDEALELAPFLNARGLRGAFLYYDARTYDTRLTLAVLRSAREGGAVAANYCEVTEFLREGEGTGERTGERLAGARVRDLVGGTEFVVRARSVVNATGVWADHVAALDDPSATPRLRPSKGVHLLVSGERLGGPGGRPPRAAVLSPSPHGDGRYLFVIPWEGVVLLGPTDTPYPGDPDRVAVEGDDVAYILTAANRLFPDLHLTEADIISTMVGLRPLITGRAESTSRLSREHRIWESGSGLISIAGGKLTTYRTMAAEATDLVLRRLGQGRIPSRTDSLPLSDEHHDTREALLHDDPTLAEPLEPGSRWRRVDVVVAALEEMAVHPDDFLARRTPIAHIRRDKGAPLRGEVERMLDQVAAGGGGGTRRRGDAEG